MLAAGVVLSTATQWRVGGSPVGVGEVFLAAWLAMSFVAVLSHGRIVLSLVAKLVLGFWCVSLILLLAGWFAALGLGVWNANRTYHDLLALSFVALLSIFLVVQPNSGREIERASGYVVLIAMGALTILYLSSLGLFSIPWADPRFGETRFTGWAKNPNQIAILSLIVPFIAIRNRQRAARKASRVSYLAAVVLAVFIGVETGSDALLVSWLLCGSMLIALVFLRWMVASPKTYWGGYVAYVLVPFVAIGFVVTAGVPLARFVWDLGATVYDAQEAQGSVRLALWQNGLRAMGASPLFGLGPGNYSGISGPFLEREAHNTFIDWGMSTGVLGLLAYGVVVVRVLGSACSRRDLTSFAGVTNLLVFSVFHYVLRHPVFWFYLIFAAAPEPSLRPDRGTAPTG